MSKDQIGETILGAIVAVVAAGFLLFAVTRAGQAESATGYPLVAHFSKVDGVSVGSDVRLAGVKVGAVSGVSLDNATYRAKLQLSIDPKVKVPEDSAAKIQTDGLLGGAYVSLEAGGSDTPLKPGAEIEDTQGSIDLLTTLTSAMANMGANGANGASGSNAAGTKTP
jgi:phospholipid/cholesterol/gamma-HCH transport system substrate-binding protein